jgi:hypothetical protein
MTRFEVPHCDSDHNRFLEKKILSVSRQCHASSGSEKSGKSAMRRIALLALVAAAMHERCDFICPVRPEGNDRNGDNNAKA